MSESIKSTSCEKQVNSVEYVALREPCSRCGENFWLWLRCSFRGTTPQGDVDVDEYLCSACGNKQDHA